jgi:hypothetical protein
MRLALVLRSECVPKRVESSPILVLACSKRLLWILTAREEKFSGFSSECFQVIIDCLARLLGHFKPDRLTRFLLPHRGTFNRIPIRGDVLDFEGNQIAAAELAIDRHVEHSEVAQTSLDLQLGSY